MQIGICSYSFHGLLAAGKQDIFQFILDCKALGCTQLDPWNGHLAMLKAGDATIVAGANPETAGKLAAEEIEYVEHIRAGADASGLPFGTLAVDGAHIYEATPEARAANRARAYRWLDVGRRLGAAQIRIDTGGPEVLTDDVLRIIKDGYHDIIDRATVSGIEIVVENHWGPTRDPDNVIKVLETVEGLGFLFDTHNWIPEKKADARRRCAKYATAVHFKPLKWDQDGNEISEDLPTAIKHLLDANYRGAWGIESNPEDGDEMGGAKKSIALLKRLVHEDD